MIQRSRMVMAAGAMAALATLAPAASAAEKPTLALVGGQVIDG